MVDFWTRKIERKAEEFSALFSYGGVYQGDILFYLLLQYRIGTDTSQTVSMVYIQAKL